MSTGLSSASVRAFARRFCAEEAGVTAIEYALLAGILATAVAIGATALGSSLTAMYDYVAAQVAAAIGS